MKTSIERGTHGVENKNILEWARMRTGSPREEAARNIDMLFQSFLNPESACWFHFIAKERPMGWRRRVLSEWVWFALTVSCSSLLWNVFFFIKYPEEGISYFWDFLFTPGDWEFRLPVIITIGLVYIGRFMFSVLYAHKETSN